VLFDKIATSVLFEKYINISALEMVSRGNRHCANYISALSFPVLKYKYIFQIKFLKTDALKIPKCCFQFKEINLLCYLL